MFFINKGSWNFENIDRKEFRSKIGKGYENKKRTLIKSFLVARRGIEPLLPE